MKPSNSRLIATSESMARGSIDVELSRSPVMPHTREGIPITPMEDIIMEDITMEGMGTTATTTTSQAMETIMATSIILPRLRRI